MSADARDSGLPDVAETAAEYTASQFYHLADTVPVVLDGVPVAIIPVAELPT
jgi:hypothetical protein